MIIRFFLIAFHDYVTKRWVNFLAKKLSTTTIPWIKNPLIRAYIKFYSLSLKDALQTDPTSYSNLHKLFTRKLVPQARKIDHDPKSIIAPADGKLTSYGIIENNSFITAKNHNYTIKSLLAKNNHPFRAGHFAIIYLAPHDYHRFHMPLTAKIIDVTYVPGSFFSVNPLSEYYIPDVFTRNERVIINTQTESGFLTIIPIGAFIVGSITLNWLGPVTAKPLNIKTWSYEKNNQTTLSKGEELGYFSFGSTIILLFTGKSVSWKPNIVNKNKVFVGEPLAYIG